MKRALLGLVSVTVVSATSMAAQSARPARVFAPALIELANAVRIPILLPSRLPSSLATSPVATVRVVTAAADAYSVELRYTGVDGMRDLRLFSLGRGRLKVKFLGPSMCDWRMARSDSFVR